MYKEVNPAIFAQVTFPFLFGVMFGDMGHGTLLFIFGLGLVFGADKLKGGPLEALAMARYLIALMGFFAIFNGLIYNEIFSMPIEIFHSCYS
jgi:V-type H+-transporting ATPase subunit a